MTTKCEKLKKYSSFPLPARDRLVDRLRGLENAFFHDNFMRSYLIFSFFSWNMLATKIQKFLSKTPPVFILFFSWHFHREGFSVFV
jgi:hypothetical protein